MPVKSDPTREGSDGDGFAGGRLNDRFTIPEYKIDWTRAVSIDSAEMYFVDKNGNETLFARFDPYEHYVFDGKDKVGRFRSLEDLMND